jgi:hypothetical protein
MRTALTWLFLIALIFIHTIDMELTHYYIDDGIDETFPVMQWCMNSFGIDAAIWISRAVMYVYFWLALVNQHKNGWFYFLVLATILYWTSMVGWSFQLGIFEWPFPTLL